MSDKTSHRQIMVRGRPVGLAGVDALFAELHAAGREPDSVVALELVQRLSADNYIPSSAAAEYAAALAGEYRRYCARRAAGQPVQAARRTLYRGIPREQIPWFPTVDAAACDGCGKCLQFCSHGVYAQDADGGPVHVEQPLDCEIDCDNCTRLCPRKAINFPPRSVISYLPLPRG